MSDNTKDVPKDAKRPRPTPGERPASPPRQRQRLTGEDHVADSHRSEESGLSNNRNDLPCLVGSQQDSAITGTAAGRTASGVSAGTTPSTSTRAAGTRGAAHHTPPRTLLVTAMAGAEGTMFGDGGARIKTGAALIGITTAGHLAIVSMSSSVIDDLLRNTNGKAPLGFLITFEPSRTCDIPNAAMRPYADLPLQQFRADRIIRVEEAAEMPLYLGKMVIRAASVGADGKLVNENQGVDGQALLILPTGGACSNGPFEKMSARVYIKTAHNQTSTATIELAIKETCSGCLLPLLDTAGANVQPLMVIGGKIRIGDARFLPNVYIGGGAIVRANPLHPLVEEFVTAATAPPVANEVDYWEHREEEPTVLPQDGPHRSAKLRPLPTASCSANGAPVLPLVLAANDRTYPVCIKDPAIAMQLPGWTFNLTDTNNDTRALFLAMADFTLSGEVTTHTVGRTTFVTRLTLT